MNDAPNEPFGYALFCDDIRIEQNGKLILIGVYAANIAFTAPAPQTLNNIFVYAHYIEPFHYSTDAVSIDIRVEGSDEALVTAEIIPKGGRPQLATTHPNAERLQLSAPIPIGPIVFDQPARLKVTWKCGATTVVGGAILVTFPSVDDAQE